MKRVFVCSPLRAATPAEVESNIRLARRLCHLAMTDKDGPVAAFAPHAFYTSFLDDMDPYERDLGMHAGKRWLEQADEIWIYTPRGISEGMAREVAFAGESGVSVVFNPECWAGAE